MHLLRDGTAPVTICTLQVKHVLLAGTRIPASSCSLGEALFLGKYHVGSLMDFIVDSNTFKSFPGSSIKETISLKAVWPSLFLFTWLKSLVKNSSLIIYQKEIQGLGCESWAESGIFPVDIRNVNNPLGTQHGCH